MSSTTSTPIDIRASEIANRFAYRDSAHRIEPYGTGLINHTYRISAGGSRYILQRINGAVFPRPEGIMSNLAVLHRHFATDPDPGFRLPALIRSRDGRDFVRDQNGAVWRLMEYLEDTRELNTIENLEQAREVGRILGRFHTIAGRIPDGRLVVTLPDFHVTPIYLKRLDRVLAQGHRTPSGALARAVGFVKAQRKLLGVLQDAWGQGRIRMRVTHGDPKLDNIRFERTRDRAVSLIDLDTVQPGLVHHDLGDCLRSCCHRRANGRADDEKASFDLDLCQAILAAYAREARGILRESETALIADAIQLIPLELGLRFLTDHLEGNRYFRITEPGQNLRRAWHQFLLAQDIQSKWPRIRDIVRSCFATGTKRDSGRYT